MSIFKGVLLLLFISTTSIASIRDQINCQQELVSVQSESSILAEKECFKVCKSVSDESLTSLTLENLDLCVNDLEYIIDGGIQEMGFLR